MYCTCGGSPGWTPAFELDEQGNKIRESICHDLWVCSICSRPSRLVFIHMAKRHMPIGAKKLLSAHGKKNGIWILRWSMKDSQEVVTTMTFTPYPRKIDMPGRDDGREVLVEMWKMLDEDINLIRSADTPELSREQAKAAATRTAEMLAIIMAPFYADKQAVLAESMTRWKARQDGITHESPGLAESIWDPDTRFDGTVFEKKKGTARSWLACSTVPLTTSSL